jgi:hypothetical protein
MCADKAEHAQDLRRGGRLLAAREELIACGAATCPTVVRGDCVKWLAEVEASLPTVIVRGRDEQQREVLDVRVLVDGEIVRDRREGIPFALDPGVHSFRVDADGFLGSEQRLTVNQGEKNRFVDLQLKSLSSASVVKTEPAPLAAYAVGGVGLLALSSFVGLEILAQRTYANLSDGCATTHSCPSSDVTDVRTKFALAGISLGVGVVATGIGVTWILLARRPARSASISVRAGLAVSGARVQVGW